MYDLSQQESIIKPIYYNNSWRSFEISNYPPQNYSTDRRLDASAVWCPLSALHVSGVWLQDYPCRKIFSRAIYILIFNVSAEYSTPKLLRGSVIDQNKCNIWSTNRITRLLYDVVSTANGHSLFFFVTKLQQLCSKHQTPLSGISRRIYGDSVVDNQLFNHMWMSMIWAQTSDP